MSHAIGLYPGGPHAPVKETPPARRLMRVENIEERIARRSTRHRLRHRRNHVLLVLSLGIPAAGGLGFILGNSRQTAEELTEALAVERSPESSISKEINRALLELWRMEEVEYTRTRQGR